MKRFLLLFLISLPLSAQELTFPATLSIDDEKEIRLLEEDANGSNYKGFKSPSAVTASTICTLEDDANFIPDSCVGNGTDDGGAIPPKEFVYPAYALAALEHGSDSSPPLSRSTGTNVDVLTATYDDSTDECLGAAFTVPANVTTGTVTFAIVWFSSSATSGNIIWDIRHSGGQAEGVTWDTALTTVAAAADATQGTVNQVTRTTWTETITNLTWAANDIVNFELCRDANNASDTLVGDARLVTFTFSVPLA